MAQRRARATVSEAHLRKIRGRGVGEMSGLVGQSVSGWISARPWNISSAPLRLLRRVRRWHTPNHQRSSDLRTHFASFLSSPGQWWQWFPGIRPLSPREVEVVLFRVWPVPLADPRPVLVRGVDEPFTAEGKTG